MRGNKILVCPEPHGSFEWGYLAGAYLPGVVLERDPTVALKAGKHTYKVYSPGADGKNPKGGYWVLLENEYLAQPATVAYASGDFAKMYSPRMGEELNLLVANLAGTADDHALGEQTMLQNASGKLVVTAGTPQNEVAQVLEAITDPVADTLAWVQWAK
jgi:hypothetical protein